MEESIENYFNKLIVRKEKFIINGERIEESNNDQYNRLSNEFQQLLRIDGQDTSINSFSIYVDRAINRIPAIPKNLVLSYALKEFEVERANNTLYGSEVKTWCSQPMEDIIDRYAEYLAYRRAIDELNYLVNPHLKGVTEIESLIEDDEVTNTEPDPKEGAEKESLVKASEVINNENDSKNNAKAVTKSKPITKATNLASLWVGENEELVLLFNQLTDKDDPFIDCPDFILFEELFYGKKMSQKIIWLKNLGLLIYLLDSLSGYIVEELYKKDKEIEPKSIKPHIISYFIIKSGKNLREFTNKSAIYTARSRFLSSLENDIQNKINAKKIDAIIQSLNID